MSKEQTIERMAQEGTRLRNADFGWTEEQLQIWMYKDPMGIREMAKMRRIAEVMYACVMTLPKADQVKVPIYEAYVEQYFPPMPGGRGYSSVIRSFPNLTKEEAIAKVREQEEVWRPADSDRSSFYVSYRKMVDA